MSGWRCDPSTTQTAENGGAEPFVPNAALRMNDRFDIGWVLSNVHYVRDNMAMGGPRDQDYGLTPSHQELK